MKLSHFCLRLGLSSVLAIAPSIVLSADTSLHSEIFLASSPLIQQSRQRYEAGQFAEAAKLLQQAADEFAAKEDLQNQAIALSNLSLSYQKLGQWEAAKEAIDASTNLLRSSHINAPDILAQTLHIRGQLFLATGQPEVALETWEEATNIYEKANDETGAIASRINQAEALQSMGLYRTALDRLREVIAIIEKQPDSPLTAKALLSLGNTLRASGQLEKMVKAEAEESKKAEEEEPFIENSGAILILEKSLEIAQSLNLPQIEADAYLTLGNSYQSLAQNANEVDDIEKFNDALDRAIERYKKAAAVPEASQTTKIQANLNLLSLLVSKQQWSQMEEVWDTVSTQIEGLPPSRQSVFARVNLAKQALELWQKRDDLAENNITGAFDTQAAELLRTAVQQAKQLEDSRAESFALGTLGTLYEQKNQLEDAQKTTENALLISQSIQSGDIAYQWQWQLGRVLEQLDKKKAAIAAYDSSVKTLSTIRSDLAATTPDLQFSFRENVEPIYRELVELLLTTESGSPSPENLELARQTIEALQLAELDNFFREACIEAEEKNIDEIDPNAAVIYAIFIKDKQQLEVIASFPNKDSQDSKPEPILRHYSPSVENNNIESVVNNLRPSISGEVPTRSAIEIVPDTDIDKRRTSLEETLSLSQQLYDWLIRPFEADLATHQTKTVVFVLDGALRSIPMSMLYDGDEYLIEKYAVALTPGLQLLEANPLAPAQLATLAAGVSESVGNFSALQNVPDELNNINQQVGGIVRLNADFTRKSFPIDINTTPWSVVHLATHGEFSSNREQTFVLASDGEINIDQLTTILQSREEGRRVPIDLLVLSACKTAVGDDRATLGLAGAAIRAGARSTVASLWLVDDKATSVLMSQFYQELAQSKKTKVQAFREAQLSLLRNSENPQWQHPYYWSAFVLVGNWK
ncbi:MAG TPA: CHAT domain-containing protein [Oscillatoriales cyanobacterium M4454_W2019_049]|nr:CHAT domain-containing protein [Oscillatoriales cyanobacterium M4454_W2019_049]